METAPRPFRFGVHVAAIPPARSLGEFAREIEDLGYAVLSCPDHLHYPDTPLEPMTLLAAAATATSTLELQPLVLANGFRHPALLAKQAATLDVISGGRFALGLGGGWYGPDFHAPGIPFPSAGQRIAALEEAVAIIRGLHEGTPFSFVGAHFRIDEMRGRPRPVRNPMPVMLGGAGRRMVSLAARIADTVALNLGLPLFKPMPGGPTPYADVTDDKLDWIRAAAGDRFPALEIQTTVAAGGITDDPETLLQPLCMLLRVPHTDLAGSPHVLAGSVDDCVGELLRWRERWGISYVTLPGERARQFAPVVAALRGQ